MTIRGVAEALTELWRLCKRNNPLLARTPALVGKMEVLLAKRRSVRAQINALGEFDTKVREEKEAQISALTNEKLKPLMERWGHDSKQTQKHARGEIQQRPLLSLPSPHPQGRSEHGLVWAHRKAHVTCSDYRSRLTALLSRRMRAIRTRSSESNLKKVEASFGDFCDLLAMRPWYRLLPARKARDIVMSAGHTARAVSRPIASALVVLQARPGSLLCGS